MTGNHATSPQTSRPITLWRLEWLRLTRGPRLIVLLAVYLFFGLTGPMLARYLPEILDRFGEGMVVSLPDIVPADGLSQYTANSGQLGLLVAVGLISGGLVIDAIAEMGLFLRSRVSPAGRLLWPRMVMSFAAVTAAFVLGLAGAWYETVVLIGALPAGAVVMGAVLTVVYLAFVVALATAIGSVTHSVVACTVGTIGVLLVLPILGLVETVGKWLPSHLPGAMDELVRDTASVGSFVPATLVTLLLTVVLVAVSHRMSDAYES